MYKYKGRYYKVLGWRGKRVLLKECSKVLFFYIEKKQKAFWADERDLKKMGFMR